MTAPPRPNPALVPAYAKLALVRNTTFQNTRATADYVIESLARGHAACVEVAARGSAKPALTVIATPGHDSADVIELGTRVTSALGGAR